MALTVCSHCEEHIWIGTGGGLTNLDRLVYGRREEADGLSIGDNWVIGITCPKCEQLHPAPKWNEEDWFE